MDNYVANPIKLFNDDCFAVLEQMPKHSVDCIITDPPYEHSDCRAGGGVAKNTPIYNDEFLKSISKSYNINDSQISTIMTYNWRFLFTAWAQVYWD